ncbi:MAG: hypothetical protein ACKE51_05345 [Methylococcaceae bacterium]
MSYEFDNVDYEDMDDLSLPDHIEFNQGEPDEFFMEALDIYGY